MQILQQLKNRLGKQNRLLAMGTSVAFIGVAANMALGMLLLSLKTRVLTQEDLGLLILAISVAITTFFLTNSLPITMIRYGSLFSGQKSVEKIKSVAISIYKLALPMIFILLLLLNIAAPSIARYYDQPKLALLIHLLSFSAFFQSLSGVNIGLLKSKYLIKYEYIALVAQMILIGLISLISMIFVPRDGMMLVFAIAYPVSSLLVFFYTCLVVRREFGFLFDRSVVAEPHGKRIFRFTLYTSLTATLSKSRDEINVFFIAFFLLTSDISLYNVAFKAAFLPLLIAPAVNAIFTPMVGNLYGKGDMRAIKRLQLKVSVIVTLFSLSMVLFYVVAAEKVLGLVFGPGYATAHSALLIMALGNVAAALAGPISFAISMMGRPHYNTVNALILLILMATLCYYLIPSMGVNGAAIAYAIANAFICLLCLGELFWVYRVEARKPAQA